MYHTGILFLALEYKNARAWVTRKIIDGKYQLGNKGTFNGTLKTMNTFEIKSSILYSAPSIIRKSITSIIRKIRHIHWVLGKLSVYLAISCLNH